MSHGPPANRRKSSADESDNISEGPTPPDGGWGWVVTFASFMIHVVNDGVTYSFGMFYVEFLKYFDSGKGETAWILSILVGVTLCSGPISSMFVNKYGCRAVTIAGAILASASLLLTSFANSILILYFTIGIGTGLGFGLIYLPAIVSVTIYFKKYRSLATGIAVCGSGLGTFIFSPLTELLIKEYGWRGATMIISGLVLHCTIFGALLRPLEDDNHNSPATVDEEMAIKENGIPLKQINGDTNINKDFKEISLPKTMVSNGNGKIMRPHSIALLTPPNLDASRDGGSGNINHHMSNGSAGNKRVLSIQNKSLALSQPLLATTANEQPHHQHHFGSQSWRSRGVLHRKDIFYQGSLMNIPQYRSRNDLKSHHHESQRMLEHRERKESVKDVVDLEESSTNLCGCSDDTKDMFSEMLDYKLLLDPIFILFSMSNFFTSIGFNVPYVYIVATAEELDIDSKDASYLLATIGVANTVGRIILGYFSDKPWVNRLWVYNVCLTVCGIATFFSAFCNDIWTLGIYASVFGFTIGAYVGLTSVILVDLLGIDKLTNAFGILLLFQGIASLIGPPIAGWLYDALKSYDPGFYVAGVMIALSGLMLFAIPTVQRYVAKKEAQKKSRTLNNVDTKNAAAL